MASRAIAFAVALAGILTFGRTAVSQDFAPFSSPTASAGGVVWGQAIGVTSIVFGSDPPSESAEPEIVLFSGLLKITKSPQLTLNDGRRQIAVAFDSRMPSGIRAARSAVMTMGYVKVAVDPDEVMRSVGTLTEIPFAEHRRVLEGGRQPQALATAHEHESAEGHAELYLVFEPGQDWRGPSFTQLRNTEPVILTGHIHKVPPVTRPVELKMSMTAQELRDMMANLGDVDKWIGANKKPVALRDGNGTPRAWFTPHVHVTTLTGTCADGVDNDIDNRVDEEEPNNIDDDRDGFVDEDSTCPR